MKLRPVVLAGVIASSWLASVTPAAAQWPPDGLPLAVASGDQTRSTVVSDGAGGAIAVWQDARNGVGDVDIYAQRFDGAGVPRWTANGVAVCAAPGNQILRDHHGFSIQAVPALAPDGAGGAIIAWADRRATGADIYVQRLDAAGVPVWTADGVALCTTGGDQLDPTIIADGAGGAIVAWRDLRSGATLTDVYAQRVNASGVPQWTANGVALCTAAGDQQLPTLTSDGAGGAIVAWYDFRLSSSPDVFAQRVGAGGTPQWTANGVAVCTAPGGQDTPMLVSDGAGGAILAWRDGRSGVTLLDIYAQRLNAAGARQWAANGIVVCDAVGDQQFPTVAGDGAGGAIITWYDFRSDLVGSTPVGDIYAQRLVPSGVSSWTPNGVRVCGSIGDQRFPYVAPDGAGGAVVAWIDYLRGTPPTPASTADIFAQRIDAGGVTRWRTNGTPACMAVGNQTFPTLVSDDAGGALVVWFDRRSGDYDVYAQRILANGAPASPLTLTGAAAAAGFSLSGFASGFASTAGIGPLGLAFTDGGALSSDFLGNTRRFAETGGRDASAVPPAQNFGASNADDIVRVGNYFYMARRVSGDLVRLRADGTLDQVIVAGMPGAAGLARNPADGHIFVSTLSNGVIYEVDPVAGTAAVLLTGIDADGLATDGVTLYLAVDGQWLHGYDLAGRTRVLVSDVIMGADGCALGLGGLAGYAFVNTTLGEVYQVDRASGAATRIAFGGSRGDFVSVDPGDCSLLLTQTDRIERLRPAAGSCFTPAAATIRCPSAVTVSTDPGSCTAAVTFTVEGGGVPAPTVTSVPPSGSAFPVGTTTVVSTAANGADPTTCSFTVTVLDGEPPVIAAPADLVVAADPGACSRALAGTSLGDPAASDNCPGVTVSHDAPAVLPVGVTLIVWTAVDAAGHAARDTQSVTVRDADPPVLTVPADIVATVGPGVDPCADARVVLVIGAASATDLCGAASVAAEGLPEGGMFPVGETLVLWTATDVADNVSSATQRVVVSCPTGAIAGSAALACDGASGPAEGITVRLLHEGSAFRSATTTASGDFRFEDVRHGTYTVAVESPPGYATTPDTRIVGLTDAEAAVDPFAFTCQLADIAGRVVGSCDGQTAGLQGITVDLYGETGAGTDVLVATTATAEGGNFTLEGVPLGDYSIGIVVPLGYTTSLGSQDVTLAGGPVTTEPFTLTCQAIAAQPRAMGYWKHQVNAHLTGKGAAQESLTDLLRFIDLMVEHFNENLVNPVVVYVPGAIASNDKLLQLQQLLTVNRGGTALDRAKQHLLALLLNVVSGKISQTEVISGNAANVSQAVTHSHDLIVDGDPANDDTARSICELINGGQSVPSGMVPNTTRLITYDRKPEPPAAERPTELAIGPIAPNPASLDATISFSLPTDAPARLEVVDLAGRMMRRMEVGSLGPGRHGARVGDLGTLPSGIYMVRLTQGSGVVVRRLAVIGRRR